MTNIEAGEPATLGCRAGLFLKGERSQLFRSVSVVLNQ